MRGGPALSPFVSKSLSFIILLAADAAWLLRFFQERKVITSWMTIGLNKSSLESQLLKSDIITTTYGGISGEELT